MRTETLNIKCTAEPLGVSYKERQLPSVIFFASFRIPIRLTCIPRRNLSQAGTERSRSSLSIARFSQLTCQCPNGSGKVCCFFSKTVWDLLLVLGLGFCFLRPVCSYREPQYDIQSFVFFFLIGNGTSCYQNSTLQLVFNTAMCSISCGRTSHQPDAAFFCRTGGTWLASFLLVRDLHRPGSWHVWPVMHSSVVMGTSH